MIQKIVYFVDSRMFGGSEQALLHLFAGLDRARWKPVLFHHAEPGIELLLNGARRFDVETRVVPRLQGMKTIRGLPQFIRQLQREKPVIFHAQLSWLLACKFGLLAAALTRVPAIFATAQQYLLPPWGKSIDLQQQVVGAIVDQYIAVSHAVAQQLCDSFRVPFHKVQVIHNSIPAEKYRCPPNTSLRKAITQGNNLPVVFTVARLDSQKGLFYLLEAIQQVSGAIFVLAGSGPEQASLEAKARNLGIDARVIFLGHRQDIPELLACCDLFVLPSIYEGFPLSVLEAMAAGKAVVATDVGGTSEAVVEGETGLLVPAKDPAALAKAIQRLLSNPSLARSMGEAGRARVQGEFSTATMVPRMVRLYDRFAEGPS